MRAEEDRRGRERIIIPDTRYHKLRVRMIRTDHRRHRGRGWEEGSGIKVYGFIWYVGLYGFEARGHPLEQVLMPQLFHVLHRLPRPLGGGKCESLWTAFVSIPVIQSNAKCHIGTQVKGLVSCPPDTSPVLPVINEGRVSTNAFRITHRNCCTRTSTLKH